MRMPDDPTEPAARPSLDRRRRYRKDRRQVSRDAFVALAAVGGAPDIAADRPELDAAVILSCGGYPFAHDLELRALRQPAIGSFPRLPPIVRAPDRDARRRCESQSLVEGDDVGGVGVVRIDRSGEAKVRRQALLAVLPVLLLGVAEVDAVVVALEELAALFRVRDHVVHALPDLRLRVRLEFGARPFVPRPPGLAAVFAQVRASGTDGDGDALGVSRVDGDGMQRGLPRPAGRPLVAGGVIDERQHRLPGHAAVRALEQAGRGDPGPDHIRRLGVTGLDVPGAAEGVAMTFRIGGIARD